VLKELRKSDPRAKAPERWSNHDLRRTARSLMSRAGVPPNHAERALGHVIAGVQGTYDRYQYATEKRQAFEALAAQIARILNPQNNVIPMNAGVR
jgi:integrase